LRIALSVSRTNEATHNMRNVWDSERTVRTPDYPAHRSDIEDDINRSSSRGDFDLADDQDLFGNTLSETIPKYGSDFDLADDQDLFSASSMAWIPSLSVQELVDCDTSFNRGCGGGSPLYAYRFIADNGLLPWSRYEYEEKVSIVLCCAVFV
jgi:hypothetical protein